MVSLHPDCNDEAFSLLAKKKNSIYIILKVDTNYKPPAIETRAVLRANLNQERNDFTVKPEIFNKIKVPRDSLLSSKSALIDMAVASITLKHTMSTSVC